MNTIALSLVLTVAIPFKPIADDPYGVELARFPNREAADKITDIGMAWMNAMRADICNEYNQRKRDAKEKWLKEGERRYDVWLKLLTAHNAYMQYRMHGQTAWVSASLRNFRETLGEDAYFFGHLPWVTPPFVKED